MLKRVAVHILHTIALRSTLIDSFADFASHTRNPPKNKGRPQGRWNRGWGWEWGGHFPLPLPRFWYSNQGANYTHHITTCPSPPNFQTFRRLCSRPWSRWCSGAKPSWGQRSNHMCELYISCVKKVIIWCLSMKNLKSLCNNITANVT